VSYLVSAEHDRIMLGQRVADALFAENEPYSGPARTSQVKTLRVSRQYATVRARAKQATERGH
jgi:hypothetical protein